ncbi:MAG TPA: hypothetical protein VF533_25350 [Solirubrobacteraceae bacterium]|jgi:hypothetical protein
MPDLTNTPALDLAIALAFIFLALSLVATAIQELVSALLALRAAKLEDGLRNMLERSDGRGRAKGERGLATEVLNQSLIASLRGKHRSKLFPDVALLVRPRWKGRRPPSYVSPRAFSLALLDVLVPEPGKPSFDKVKDAVTAKKLPAGVQKRLLLLLDEAGGDVDRFRRNAEAWFDDTMARVSGWYKRQAQIILAVIAAALTIGLNVNTIAIAERIWDDPSVRAAVVAAAQSPEVTGSLEGETAKEKLANAAANAEDLPALGIPVGWSGTDPSVVPSLTSVERFLRTVGGWLITIAALSLGAPFWFDALSRLSRLRGTGKPEAPLPASERGAPNERTGGLL